MKENQKVLEGESVSPGHIVAKAYCYDGTQAKIHVTEDIILVAHDLLPNDMLGLDLECIKGIVTEVGGANTHCGILAKYYEIPAVLAVQGAMKYIKEGAVLDLNATEGKLSIIPKEQEAFYLQEVMQSVQVKDDVDSYMEDVAVTSDGERIAIGVNICSKCVDIGRKSFDYIGLCRTEFFYMNRDSFPSEEEQFEDYKYVIDKAEGKMVVLRTFDIGGDKKPGYMMNLKEENVVFGKRGFRFYEEYEELLMSQLRAALRASHYGPLKINFPMIGSLEDVYRAKDYVKKAKKQLDALQIPYNKMIEIGVVFEVPELTFIADYVADEVDFASIGSNDLTQYCCVADRQNSQMKEFYQNYSPAMLRLMKHLFDTFHKKGKGIGICGELAGDAKSAILLMGLGAKSLSMSPMSIGHVKAAIAKTSMTRAKQIADHCLSLKTEQEVLNYLEYI